MANPLYHKSWSPCTVGMGIGILSWSAFASADHPIGVTTAFEHTAALAIKTAAPAAEHSNEYFAKKASEGKSPKIDWEWMLVIGVAFLSGGLMMFGARLAQGCRSGHGISGTMHLALSSWIFYFPLALDRGTCRRRSPCPGDRKVPLQSTG